MQKLRDGIRDGRLNHCQHFIPQRAALQYLLPLLIDDFTLLIHYVVVGQHILSAFKVLIFQPLLGTFNGVGKDPGVDGIVFGDTQTGNHSQNTIAAEQTH